MAEEAKWYVIHTYSGYENTVKVTIEKSIENRHLQDLIHEVLIPMETVTEVTDSGTKIVERKVYPGYVMLKMVMTDEAWYIVNSVRGVTGFVGADADAKPMIRAIPLTDDEVLALGIEKREIEVPYEVGDTVCILDGPLTNFNGRVDAIDTENNSVRVEVSMFGRATPVELELDQVELVQE